VRRHKCYKNLNNRNFGKKDLPNFHSKQAAIAGRPRGSENIDSEEKPPRPKTEFFSRRFAIKACLFFKLLLCFFLSSCSHRNITDSKMVSIQLIDRNGFSETISSPQRLESLEKTDFFSPQPYQKILRVYWRNSTGHIPSKLSSYHPNGQIWQYLEILDGRAHGVYREWHANGQLKLEVNVIEGMAELNELAQVTWLFDGKSCVHDELGQKVAEINYEKGALEGPSFYFYPDGSLQKCIVYSHDLVEGEVKEYDEQGHLIEIASYEKGKKHGTSVRFQFLETKGTPTIQFQESYREDLLMQGTYFDREGKLLSSIDKGNGFQTVFKENHLFARLEYRDGLPCGKVEFFRSNGTLSKLYFVKEGKKEGEEWEYFPDGVTPKLLLSWRNDSIQGTCKTWYSTGQLESQREVHQNQKQGLSFAWYLDGQLMLVEEYENDRLLKGTYFKKGDKDPVSRVEKGKGIATLFDQTGHFLKKIPYEKGTPQLFEDYSETR
jgi:antitoxin component YwqK of YwqJK toxin-antitoxin module